MKRVRLVTQEGRHIKTVDVPAMNPPPDVVIFEDKVFLYISAVEYAEGTSYRVLAEEKPKFDGTVEKIPSGETS